MFEDEFDRVIHPRRIGDIYLYSVRPGDNVYRIARNFNTKIEWIACMNNLNPQMTIYPNQQLYIPFIPQGPMPRDESKDSYELYF